MKKTLIAVLCAVSLAAQALPTYEPFTEFAPVIATTPTNLVVISNGVPLGTNANASIPNCIDLATGGYSAPSGEAWGLINYSGDSGTPGNDGALQGLDIAVISNATIFTQANLSSLLPANFPGLPASGQAITNVVENPAQPLVWNPGAAKYIVTNLVGNSAVLKFASPVTRPATGSKTLFWSYLISIAQAGQAGTGNDGRYLGFLCSSNLNLGKNNTFYPTWNSFFNVFGTNTTNSHFFGNAVFNGNPDYLEPVDNSAGKETTATTFATTYNTPSFVVGEFVFTTNGTATLRDTNALWVNPATSSFGGATPPLGSALLQVVSNAMTDVGGLILIDRSGNGASGGVGTNYIANLLIGSTWSYVTGGPEFTNQPVASSAVNIGGTLNLTAAATAAAQTVSYQWQKISSGVTNNISNGAGGAGGSATVSGATTASLTLTGFSAGDAGTYQLVATASGTGYALASSQSLITVADPLVTASPASVATNYGGAASFTATVTTSHAPLTYRWYFGSTPLSNGTQADGSTVSGAGGTTSSGSSFNLTLNLSNVSYQEDGAYTLYVTNASALFNSSIPATLTVNDPYISSVSTSGGGAGGNATFTVVAGGSPTVTYQWYENGTALSEGGNTVTGSAIATGTQTATLTLRGVSDSDNGSYYCTVSSGSGATTNSVTFNYVTQDALTVVTTPKSLTERVGDHLAFSTTAIGGGGFYQWKFNGAPISGATNSALVLTNIQTSQAGTYSVVVSNLLTSPVTYSATLTVVNSSVLNLAHTNLLVARVGDGAQTLSGVTGNTLYLDQYTPAGVYVSTVQIPDEAVGSPYGTGSSASVYGSPALLFAGAGVDADNEAFLTVSGGNQEYLNLAGYCQQYPYGGPDVTAIASAATGWRGLATIDAFGIYSLAYTNFGLYSGGNHTIRSMVTADGTNFWTTGQAGSVSGVKNVSTTYNSYNTGSGIPSIIASTTGPRVVQIVNGNLTFSDAAASPTGIYQCAGTPVIIPGNTTNSSLLINEGGSPADFAFSPDLNTVYIADTQGFSGSGSQSGGIQRWDTNASSGGYSWSYTLPADPTQTLGAAGLTVDFSANATWGPGVTGAKLYATSYGASSNTLVSLIDTGSGSTPNLLVSVGTNNALRGVRFGPAAVAPAVVSSPQSQTNFPGNSVTFSAVANGSAPLFYQWYYNSAPIAGATLASFTTNGISFASAGNYSVVVSNLTGATATSATAVLTVTAGAPTVSQVPSYRETVGDHLALSPTVLGSSPITNYWYLGATLVQSNTDTTGGPSLIFPYVQTANNGTYTLVVSNAYGHASSSGVLTVTASLQSLSSNNLVVARVGDGAQALSGATGNTVYLDQYTTSGAYSNTIQIPDEAAGTSYGTGSSSSIGTSPALIVAGSGTDAAYEAILSRSPNGQTLSLGGYCQAYPFSGADVTLAAQGGAIWRGIEDVDAFGSYALAYTNSGLYGGGAHELHSAADIDGNGTNWYTTGEAGGGPGVKYCNVNNEQASGGGIVSVTGSFGGSRVVQVINGNILFTDVGASPAGLYFVSGEPSAAATSTLLIAETNSPLDFAVSPDGATVYIADNGSFTATNNETGGIQRWDTNAVSGGFTFSYTLPTGAGITAGARAITADFSANATWGAGVKGAKLYATTAENSGNRLIKLVDNGPASSATTLITATASEILAGVRFGPAVIAPTFASEPQSATANLGAAASFSAGVSGSGPFTYQWYFQANGVGSYVALSGATNATYTIGSVGSGNAGNYYVIAKNPALASAQSTTVALTVNGPPHFISESYLGAGTGFQLFFTGTAGQSYSIWTSTNVSQPRNTWTQLTTGQTFSGGTDSYTDTTIGSNPKRFYYISVP